jgi:hypothetical protein
MGVTHTTIKGKKMKNSMEFFMQVKDAVAEAPYRPSMIMLDVEIRPTKLFDILADSFILEIYRLKRTFAPDDTFKPQLLKYMKTILYHHVQNVKSELPQTTKLLYDTNRINIPAILWFVMDQVGVVRDSDFNIQFNPVFNIPSTDLLSNDELLEFSEELYKLNIDIMFEYKLPNPKLAGNVESMSKILLESGHIFSYRSDHPVTALISAVLGFTTSIQQLAMRYDYGDLHEYEMAVRSIRVQADKRLNDEPTTE